jgi:type 1 fimbria pilin
MKKTARFLAAAGAFVLLHLLPNESHAAICTTPYDFRLQGPASINFDPALAVGATLWTGSVPASWNTGGGQCSGGTFALLFRGIGSPAGNIYPTGIDGIGYRVRMANMCYSGWWPGRCSSQLWAPGVGKHNLQVELVKTGPISGGGALSGRFGEWLVDDVELYLSYSWTGSVIVKPVIPTCSVTTPSVPVPLGSIPASRFSGVGSTSASQGFNIALQCSGGDAGRTTDIFLTLTDQANQGNRSNVLSLSDGATAKGVGIQIKSGSTIVSYGPDSAAADNPGRWYAGRTGNGAFNIPLSASYVQTESTVKAGTADGKATFTMSYQ